MRWLMATLDFCKSNLHKRATTLVSDNTDNTKIAEAIIVSTYCQLEMNHGHGYL